MQGADAGRPTAGDTGGMRSQTQNQHFSKNLANAMFKLPDFSCFSCFHLHLCICHMLYHFIEFSLYVFASYYVTGNGVISVKFRGSRSEFVFTNMLNRCRHLVFQNSPVLFHIQNCTLSQLAWFSAHYMSHKLIEITEACNRKSDVECGCERGGQNICLWWFPIREFPSTSLVPPARGLSASTVGCLSLAYTWCHL